MLEPESCCVGLHADFSQCSLVSKICLQSVEQAKLINCVGVELQPSALRTRVHDWTGTVRQNPKKNTHHTVRVLEFLCFFIINCLRIMENEVAKCSHLDYVTSLRRPTPLRAAHGLSARLRQIIYNSVAYLSLPQSVQK